MKKLVYLLFVVFTATSLLSCGNKKSTEDKVRNYARFFMTKVNNNEIDSLKETYPDISEAISLAEIEGNTIDVVETSTPGEFDIIFANGVSLRVVRYDDGEINVIESHGLFKFQPDRVELAMKTGLWDDKLNDVKLAKRMNDRDFFEYLREQVKKKTSKILTYSKFDYDKDYQYIINNSDEPVSGSDYKINYIEEGTYWYDDGWGGGYEPWSDRSSQSGKDIPAHGKVKVDCWVDAESSYYVTGVKWTISQEEIEQKYASFTGNEYQEYLDSKK